MKANDIISRDILKRLTMDLAQHLLGLAVLCDFGDREPGEVVGYIVRRLRELLVDDERRFREYMTMLELETVQRIASVDQSHR